MEGKRGLRGEGEGEGEAREKEREKERIWNTTMEG